MGRWMILAVAVLAVSTILSVPLLAQPRVTAVAGDAVTLSVGSRDGVRVGMTGTITTTMMVGGEMSTFNIARFRVGRVEARSSRAVLTDVGGGWTLDAGMGAVFDQPLVRPTPEPRPTAPPPPGPTPAVPQDPVELLLRGTEAWDRQDWVIAATHYEALLLQMPGHPVAAERAPVARRRAEEAQRATEQARREAEERARREREAREAAERERQNLTLYRETARILLEEGRWADAVGWLKRITAVYPDDSFVLGVVERRIREIDGARTRGDRGQAVRMLEELSEIAADHPGVVERKGMLIPSAGRTGRFSPSNSEYISVRAGSYWMGCVSGDTACASDEQPRRRVSLSRDFWIMKTPVSVAEYQRFARATGRLVPAPPPFNPNWRDSDHPIVRITWQEAVDYCGWAGGRLPTEAEWEFAARGGAEGQIYPWGNQIGREYANYSGTGGVDRWVNTSPVGSFPANGFGLYDMAGNVWEWVADLYDAGAYSSGPAVDPHRPTAGPGRVVRGGSWVSRPEWIRTSFRYRYSSTSRNNDCGFRCVREVD